ncbi:bifunctional metallophosphatase/5'-nucleotidase [Actinocatenispora sera]|uniref:5'-nucleotidase n=1 Tax=Actinocatenispora sera TaxID=390989 RepID=A0A810L0I6_9ACTN|nr:5'-nucleotidase C-terminal domain-containing protein [Actinocatenispora sera]BCJ27748.1 5'-nucleotidase [Actinocatenispora sera]
MHAPISRRTILAAGGGIAAATAVGGTGLATAAAADPASTNGYVDVQLLNITDLHGYLQPPADGSGGLITGAGGATVRVGGVAYLASHLKRIRRSDANSIFCSAGDNFSGWPYEVDSQNNEPTIEVLNKLGLRFSSVGNHELDKSTDFLLHHMQDGHRYPYDEPFVDFVDSTGRRFHGADWTFHTGNVVHRDGNRLVAPAYNIEYVDAGRGRRIPIGFIHLTVEGCVEGPGFNCSYQPTLATTDLIAAANRSAAALKRRGVNALIVVMHEGGVAGSDYNAGTNPTGPAFDLAAVADPDIAAIVTGHWHCRFNMMVPGPDGVPRPVTEAGCNGQLVTEVNLKLDPSSGRFVRELTSATNHAVTRDVPADPEVRDIVDYWVAAADRLAATPIARQTGDLVRTPNADGESTLGNFVADFIQWDAEQDGPRAAAEFAFLPVLPPVGRSALTGDLPYATESSEDGVISYGAAWRAYGFDSPIVTVTMTGDAFRRGLEQQWQTQPDGSVKYAPVAVSRQVRYRYDVTKPVGQRIDPATVTIDGAPLDPDRGYRVATNAYTVLAYDGYPAFTEYTDAVRHSLDHEGFIRYLRLRKVVSPPALGRARSATGEHAPSDTPPTGSGSDARPEPPGEPSSR